MNHRMGFDIDLDGIMDAAREFGERMREMGGRMAPAWDEFRGSCDRGWQDSPFAAAAFPPANIYKDGSGAMVLEFALAGFDPDSVSVSFSGDDLVLSARLAAEPSKEEELRWSRRGFKPRNVERQRYRVPAADYDQEKAAAKFRNGLLTVRVPLKEPEGQSFRVEIVKEGS